MGLNFRLTKKKIIICAVAAVLLIAIILGTVVLAVNLKNNDSDSEKNGQFRSLSGKFTDIKVTDANSAIDAAKDAAKTLGLENAADELTVKNESTVDGITYYRLQQNYNDIEVCGRSVVIIANQQGEVQGCTSNMLDIDESELKDSELTEKDLLSKASSFLDISKSKIVIESAKKKINNINNTKLYYDTWVSYIDGENTYLYNLYIPTKGDDISYGFLDINPYAICESNDGQIFQGTIVTDGGKHYLMYNLDDKIYCLTANGNITYSYKKQEHIKNSSQAISSPTSKFVQEYNFAFSVANDLQDIKQWYIDEYNDKATDGVALIIDSGTGTVGGLMPTSTLDALKLSNYKEDNIGTVQIGKNDRENLSFQTIAHEYTHIVSQNIVDWMDGADYSKPNEYDCINEAYSDLFGMIIDSKVNNKDFSWKSQRTDLSTMEGYPKKVNTLKTYVESGVIAGGDATVDTLWVDMPNGGQDIPYMYAYAVTLQYAAYLMNTAKENSLTIDEIDLLWYNTMLTLPSNCTFSVLRDNMEMTAKFIGFSEAKIACVRAAFDEVGIGSSENDDGYAEYSTELTVQALTSFSDDLKPTGQYKIKIDGKKNAFLLFTTDYYDEIEVTDSEPVALELPEGEFTVSVTDGENTYSQKIKTVKNSANTKLTFITDFAYVGDLTTPSEADFEGFKKMFEETFTVWNNSKNFTSSNLTVTEIIDDYIMYYQFAYYFTLFDNTTIEHGKDPLNKLYDGIKFDGEKIDWIIENVFGKKTDHTSTSKEHYYYNGDWYVEGAQGVGDTGIAKKSITEKHELISGNKYKITIYFTFNNTHTDKTERWAYTFIASANYDKSIGNYWSIEEFSKTTASADATVNSTSKQGVEAILGVYEGTYTASQGVTGLTLSIYKTQELLNNNILLQKYATLANSCNVSAENSQNVTATSIKEIVSAHTDEYIALFYFYPTNENPDVESGLYTMSVKCDENTGKYEFISSEWIQHDTYVLLDLKNITLSNDVLSGDVYAEYTSWFWTEYSDIGDVSVSRVA